MPSPLLPEKPTYSDEYTHITWSPFEFVGTEDPDTGKLEGWVYLGTEVLFYRLAFRSNFPEGLDDFIGWLRKQFAKRLASVLSE